MEPKLVNAVQAVDNTFLFIFGVSALLLAGITVAMIWFVIRYSRKRNPNPAQFHGNLMAEVIWIVLPTLLVMAMFYSGWHSYRALREAPAGALEVKVTARMWSWDFEYANGKHSGTLVVPVGRPVRLVLTSSDVLHGFFAPAFRIKVDTVPGMTTYAWFRADKPGEHVVFCSVYCGLQHAKMLTAIRAVAPEDFDAFLAQAQPGKSHAGKALLDAKGCLGCHSLDGTDSVGPTLKGAWGRGVILVGPDKKEQRATLDAPTLTMLIMGPRTGVVKGYEPVMPAYADQITKEELAQILDYLEHGDADASGVEAGRALADSQGCLGCHSLDGTEIAGPSLKGLYGKKSTAKDGAPVDRAFINAVLKDPSSRLGRTSSMPAYPQLTDAERDALTAFIESLAMPPDGAQAADAHKGHEAAAKPASGSAGNRHDAHKEGAHQ
jgi:cytochrome c oxidase subunit 2